MSNDNNDWIKMNERCPTNADMPIFRLQELGGKVRLLYDASFNECADGWWRKADIPAPPKPEPTQREDDEAEALRWCAVKANPYPNICCSVDPATAFMAGIAYRDAQNRADLAGNLGICWWNSEGNSKSVSMLPPDNVDRLRRRCGLST